MEKMQSAISIGDEGDAAFVKKKQSFLLSRLPLLLQNIRIEDPRKLIHSIKMGIALVLVSLLYLLDPIHDQVGNNAMWAIMTVVVVFEFSAGGGLGCLTALLAFEIGGVGRTIAIGTSVFIFGAAASYFRLVPSIKIKYDYGALIFILTFNLVAVSGFRGKHLIKLASDRLLTIMIGFVVCVATNLFILPVWAGDELHCSLVSKFKNLALWIEECSQEYFKPMDEKMGTQTSVKFNGCKSVLYSKSTEETLARFAKWEPWHGKFGFSYPWKKYLCIGELLRELAASTFSLKGSLKFHQQESPQCSRMAIKEPCEAVGTLLSFTLRELGDDIFNKRHSRLRDSTVAKLKTARLELYEAMSSYKKRVMDNGDEHIGEGLAIAGFICLLTDIVDKVEVLVKEVEELGDLAGFLPQLKL
ncbi:aluminum-activated malate transporter 12-like isoform X2 [Tasmannia lanceolata]|uniref:aluminum-activated malate transporter 12-like isoform X2 n=1 Tax=Tasmannia lanceolata TaxID=3420 RepID=UPI004064103E